MLLQTPDGERKSMNCARVGMVDLDMDWETVDKRQTHQMQSKANRARVQGDR